MSISQINIALRPYDQFNPLIIGAAEVSGFQVNVDFRAPLSDDFSGGFHAREISFNRYVLAHAKGDNSLMGLPAFVLRGFRHRNYIVHRSSPITELRELTSARIGTNSWSDTGTMWARAALREAGVDLEGVRWVIGDLDDTVKVKPPTPLDVPPPSGSERLAENETLLDGLRKGTLDAVTTAFVPNSIYQRDGEFRRLIPDFRQAEVAYHDRTGVYPAFHIVAVQRSFAERSPEAVIALYEALIKSWQIWWAKTKNYGDASPWAIEEAETLAKRFPDDLMPFGTKSPSHRHMLASMCVEQLQQKLVAKAANPESLFAEFNQIAAV
jgi:4,5-dihydroxyphthalate decarboxylase